MKNIRVFLGILSVVGWLALAEAPAQTQTQKPAQDKSSDVITRSVEVKNAVANRIIETLLPIARATGTTMAADPSNKLIVIAGNPERVSEMENLIRRLDVPSFPSQDVSVEITAYLLAAGDTTVPGQPVPPQLEPALKQLRSTFTYKSYQLLDTLYIRNLVGRGALASGSFPAEIDGKATNVSYNFRCSISHITGEVIHLEDLRIETGRGSIGTNIDIRAGQMVVVGKTSLQGNQALIAVITAKIVL